MGITYKAIDTTLHRTVALKVINPDTFSGDAARQRFLREARAAAQLKHPSVASVFHLGKEGDTHFYAMEFIEGETLEALVRREGPLRCGLALQIAGQVAAALAAAHGAHLVHRDIKPSNLMLVREIDGQPLVKVIDFGLAKMGGAAAGRSDANLSTGGFLGTPHFASPEQVCEKEIDIRSDIYSLGATLWHMLTGNTLYSGSLARIMIGHLSEPPPYDQIDAPEPVLDLLEKMLAKNVDDRFQTPAVLLTEIRRVASTVDPNFLCRMWSADNVDRAETVQQPAVRRLEPLPDLAADSACATTVDIDVGLTPPGSAGSRASSAPPAPPLSPAPTVAPEQVANSTPASVPVSVESIPAAATVPSPIAPTRRFPIVPALGIFLLLAAGAAAGGGWLASHNPEFFARFGWNPLGHRPFATPVLSSTPNLAGTKKTSLATPVATATPVSGEEFKFRPAPTPAPLSFSDEQKLKLALGNIAELQTAGNYKGALYESIKLCQNHPKYSGGLSLMNDILSQPKLKQSMDRDWHAFSDLIDQAATLGSGKAMLLGAEHERASDPAKAFQLYKQAAEKGVPQAMTETGSMYLRGMGVARDPAAAEKWFLEASAHEDPSGAFLLGQSYLTGKGLKQDIPRGLKLVQDAADHKSAEAKNLLGKLYLRGDAGVPASRQMAVDCFRQAREANCAEAFYNTAYLDFTVPLRVRATPTRAAFFLQRGADLGDPFCAFYYAKCLEGGIGVTAAPDQAREWFGKAVPMLQRLAGEEGSVPAKYCLAMCIDKGSGIAANPRAAANMCKVAAAEGDQAAREWCTEKHLDFGSGTAAEPLGEPAMLPMSLFKPPAPTTPAPAPAQAPAHY